MKESERLKENDRVTGKKDGSSGILITITRDHSADWFSKRFGKARVFANPVTARFDPPVLTGNSIRPTLRSGSGSTNSLKRKRDDPKMFPDHF